MTRLLEFFRKPPPEAPAPPKQYGLFTLAPGDIVISRPLYDVILSHLRTGTPEARRELADKLDETTKGMY